MNKRQRSTKRSADSSW